MSTKDSVQLLRAYADQGDEAAFRQLVSRYSFTSWGYGAQADVEVVPGETVSLTVEGNTFGAPDHAMPIRPKDSPDGATGI